ncbi:MAG: flagellar hook-associated protein FlgK [Acidobacteriota bacterium]
MSGLFDSLSIATSALTAYRTGLDVAGQNIANINTPGYVRRTVTLAERAPTEALGPGHGVDVLGIQAHRSELIDGRIGHEQAGLSHDSALLDGLKEVESAIGLPGSSLDADLDGLFTSFSQLATDVTSSSARDSVVRQAQTLAQGFGALSGRITELQRSTNVSVRDAVGQLNQLTDRFAQLNGQIISRNGTDVEALKDERANVLADIQSLADVSVITRGDGGLDLTMPQGQALVLGGTSNAVSLVSTAPSGAVSLMLSDFDVTSQVTNGRLGGLITLRDTVLGGYQTNLDQLAYDVATQVNAVHASGYDANGNAAGNFFTAPAAVAGAAAAMAVDPSLAADSQLLAGSATGAVGDNQTARALAGIRNARVMSGGTATAAEAWSNFVYQVGSDVATAQSTSGTREAVVRQLQQLRDQASGVSLDEEAANLMKFQRSYEASARFFTTVNDTLTTLMAMVQ